MKLFNIVKLLTDKDIFHWDKTNSLIDKLNSIEITESTENGAISFSSSDKTDNVSVHGLTKYAFAKDINLEEGTDNGEINLKIDDEITSSASVHGLAELAFMSKDDLNLGSMAYENAEDYIKKTGEMIGIIYPFAGNGSVPRGYLLCDGSAVSRSKYSALYSVIKETYGAGDGSTTFNLPNLNNRFIEGSSTAGTQIEAGLPNITGFLSNYNSLMNYDYSSGALSPATNYTSSSSYKHYTINYFPDYNIYTDVEGDYNSGNDFSFDASNSNSIYGNSTTVQPPAITMRYIIRAE